MGQCLKRLSNIIEETEPAPHSFKASIRANETAKATHKGNILLTDSEIRFYENKQGILTSEPLYQWELNLIRKYGIDKKIFSLHAGSRTKTGEGVFLFRCKNAVLLGKEIEERIAAMQAKEQQRIENLQAQKAHKGNSQKARSSTNADIEVDGEQGSYINLKQPSTSHAPPNGCLGEDQQTSYVNMAEVVPAIPDRPKSPEVHNQTMSYTELVSQSKPPGSMSPRINAAPEQTHATEYNTINIEITKAMAQQTPITSD